MAYSDFTLDRVVKTFGLTISSKVDLYSSVPELKCSDFLAETIRYNLPFALGSNTEKSRSEMIISPILLELIRQLNFQASLFSGIDFSVDAERGLNGTCDFLISRLPEFLMLKAPVIIIVEAKKENINAGLGQCIAEMVAARIFNEREGENIPAIYGTVTTGTTWKFLKLEGEVINIDLPEYYLNNVNKILGILASGLNEVEK
ncbi:hypothetical protein LAY41_05130 [Argonema galeatum A003/A1]|nr:hypothetical protein [Argonema galeatum]MCL1463816.1 hypothetical protein [Argonema galeatum A003/A1]